MEVSSSSWGYPKLAAWVMGENPTKLSTPMTWEAAQIRMSTSMDWFEGKNAGKTVLLFTIEYTCFLQNVYLKQSVHNFSDHNIAGLSWI